VNDNNTAEAPSDWIFSHVGKPKPMGRVVWMLISGAAENNGSNLRERVLPSARTWLKSAPPDSVFAVFARTNETIAALSSAGCKQTDTDSVFLCETDGATVTAILTSCLDQGHDGEHYAEGPCCKWDASLQYLRAKNLLAAADWVYVADDDMYVDVASLSTVLSDFQPEKPYMVNADGSTPDVFNGQIGMRAWNKPIKRCNAEVPQGFFYSMMSRGLVSRMLDDRIAPICKHTGGAYDTTVGLAAWKHGASFIPAFQMTKLLINASYCEKLGQMETHGVFYHGLRSADTFTRCHASISKLTLIGLPKNFSARSTNRTFHDGDACADLFA